MVKCLKSSTIVIILITQEFPLKRKGFDRRLETMHGKYGEIFAISLALPGFNGIIDGTPGFSGFLSKIQMKLV